MKGQNKEQPTYYYGTQANFDGFVENQTLVKGRIYFIVKAKTYAKGFIKADDGVIYVATSPSTFVRFGSFSTEDDIDEIVERIEGEIQQANDRIDGKVGKTDYITDTEIEDMDATERNGHFLDNLGLVKLWNRIVSFFVQKEDGKGLSSNDYTTAEKNKLAGIASGAEVNVQSDWNQTNTSSDDYIKNKPSVYTKSEVDTALNGKQDSITITTSTATPADNDTVIMQASGTTNTTSFVRRSMSKIWDYFKGKADGVYMPLTFVNLVGDSKNLWDNILDGKMWGADKRFNVTWVSYNIESGEVVETKDAKNLFNMSDNYYKHPITGEKDIITISPKDGLSSSYLWIYCNGYYYLNFYSTKLPESATLRWKQRNSDTWNTATFETFGRGNQLWRAQIPWGSPNLSTYVNTIEITIIGKTDSEFAWPGTSVCNLTHICSRESLGERGVVTKYAIAQNLYGKLNLMYDSGAIASGEKGAVTGETVYTALQNAIAALEVTDTETANKAVTAVSETDGKIAVTRRTIGSIGEAVSFIQSSYDAQHSAANEYQKVLTLAKGDSCVLNITKVVYGSPIQTTVWLSNGNNVDFSMLKECAGLVTTGGGSGQSVTLLIPVVPQQGYPHATLKIHVVRQTDDDSLTFHNSSPEYVVVNHPRKPAIVMRDEISNDAVTFNITGGTGSVSLADSFDFIGNVTDASASAGITVTNYEQGQCYRFTFTEELEGVTLYSGNSVALCTVNETIQKGDVLTFTSVSNTAGGWMYSKTGASIKSSDGSVGIEWEDGVADLSVPVTPPNIVLNRSEVEWENDRTLSIGMGAQAQSYSGDESEPYAYTDIGGLSQFKVDGGSNEYYHAVTAGTTYSINRSGTIVSYTPSVSGYVIICNLNGSLASRRYDFSDNNHKWVIITDTTSVSTILEDTVTAGSNQYIVGVINASASSVSQFGAQSTVRYWGKYSTRQTANIAICAFATGKNTIAIGSSSYGSNSITIGKNGAESQKDCIVMGYSAKASAENAVLIGNSAKTKASDTIAIGNRSEVGGRLSMAIGQSANVSSVTYALAIGNSAKANGGWSVAIGAQAKTTDSNSIAIGAYSNANKGIAIGRNSNAAYASDDSNLPYYKAKRFSAVNFTVGGETKLVIRGTYGENVTISVNGTQKTVTPPSNSQLMLCVVNDSSAGVMGKFVSDYPMADGKVAYCPNMQASSVSGDNITGNYYAVWFRCDNIQSYIDALVNASTFSFLAYYKTNATSSENFAIGYDSYALCNGIAIGRGAVAIRDSQVVIGNYSVSDDDARLIIGGGTAGNSRKNILTIDGNENLHVRKVHEDGIYYCGSAGLQNIVMGDAIYVSGVADQYIDLPENNVKNGTSFRFIAKYACKIRQGWTVIADMAQGTFKDFVFLDGTWYVS